MHNIAVIGAGMAGCTLARRLIDAGRSVQVFDKGRAAGGRMATRAAGRLRFDHGAQFISVRGETLQGRLATGSAPASSRSGRPLRSTAIRAGWACPA